MSKNFSKVTPEHYGWMRSWFQNLYVFFIFTPLLKLLYNVKVEGRENIPRDEKFIVAANHQSYWDPPALRYAIKYKNVAYMAKKELFEVPGMSWTIQMLGAFAVDREKVEISTIKSAKNVLKTDWTLGIFPQGTRVFDKIGDVKPGFGFLAKSTKTQILPVAITGIKERKMRIKIGKPIPAPETAEEAVENWKKAISELTGWEYIPSETQESASVEG